MFVAGVDVGSRYIKVVIVNSTKKIKGKKTSLSGYDSISIVEGLIRELCNEIGIKVEDIKKKGVTGSGKEAIDLDSRKFSEVMCASKAVFFLYPAVRTIIEVGAEESRAIKINGAGKIVDTIINEKCAAGTGTFVELMARTLEMELKEFGEKSLESEKKIPMNAQCIVFAESEVVSLIHSGVDRKDIAKAIHDAIASRIAAMTRRLKVDPDVVLIGGLAKNPGFIVSLRNNLEVENIVIPEFPEYMGAYGAALLALES